MSLPSCLFLFPLFFFSFWSVECVEKRKKVKAKVKCGTFSYVSLYLSIHPSWCLVFLGEKKSLKCDSRTSIFLSETKKKRKTLRRSRKMINYIENNKFTYISCHYERELKWKKKCGSAVLMRLSYNDVDI